MGYFEVSLIFQYLADLFTYHSTSTQKIPTPFINLKPEKRTLSDGTFLCTVYTAVILY